MATRPLKQESSGEKLGLASPLSFQSRSAALAERESEPPRKDGRVGLNPVGGWDQRLQDPQAILLRAEEK